MLRRTNIGWADYSGGDLNFVIGCTPVSEGCQNCYAKTWARRTGRDFSDVQTHWDKLNRLWKAKWDPGDKPYRRGPGSKPIMFPVDLGDLFHEEVEYGLILTALDFFASRDDADWVLLTKRPKRMRAVINRWVDWWGLGNLPPNIWCLVTTENQQRADERIPVLLQVKAQVRGASIEPMLGAVSLLPYLPLAYEVGLGDKTLLPGLSWIICGAESGAKRRLFNTLWAEDLWRQCFAAGVPFFGKQDSGLKPGVPLLIEGREIKEFPK